MNLIMINIASDCLAKDFFKIKDVRGELLSDTEDKGSMESIFNIMYILCKLLNYETLAD